MVYCRKAQDKASKIHKEMLDSGYCVVRRFMLVFTALAMAMRYYKLSTPAFDLGYSRRCSRI